MATDEQSKALQDLSSQDLSAEQCTREDFEAMIAPVERLACDCLVGRTEEELWEAFQRHPEAFAECVARTLKRAEQINAGKPLGLLVKIVRTEHARRTRRLSDPAAGGRSPRLDPAAAADNWMRTTGFRFQRDDALTMLEDTFRVAGDERERLTQLWDELQRERAAARAELERSLHGVAA